MLQEMLPVGPLAPLEAAPPVLPAAPPGPPPPEGSSSSRADCMRRFTSSLGCVFDANSTSQCLGGIARLGGIATWSPPAVTDPLVADIALPTLHTGG